MINEGIIMGYISGKPKLDYVLATGTPSLVFTLFCIEDERKNSFHITFTIYGAYAINCSHFLKERQCVVVHYTLRSSQYIDKEGKERTRVYRHVTDIAFAKITEPPQLPKRGEKGWEEWYYDGINENGIYPED